MKPFCNPLALRARVVLLGNPRSEVGEAEREAIFVACVAVLIPLVIALVTAA